MKQAIQWTRQVRSLGWEYLLEEELETHSSILAWKIPWTEEPGGYSPWGREESDMTEQAGTFGSFIIKLCLQRNQHLRHLTNISRHMPLRIGILLKLCVPT